MLPNILLVFTDQQRYDTLGCCGNGLIRTPNLDRFAAQGTLFHRAYVNCPICVPSRVSLFTGRYAHTTGSISNGILMQDTEVDYALMLRQHGYTTALIGKDHCFGSERLQHSFDSTLQAGHTSIQAELSPQADAINAHRHGTMGIPLATDPVPPEHNITGSLFAAARTFVGGRSKTAPPFFLWLSIPDPHPPYMVCEPYASMYQDVDVPLPAWQENEMATKPDRQKLIVESGRTRQEYPDDEALRDLKRTYWGMVSYIDDEFGRLMQVLDDSGQADNTIVVFTSDHGDYMGDHLMTRKGPHVYEALTHVPMIVRAPGQPGGRQTHALVSNVDVFPTLAEFIGIASPDGVDGQSFVGLVTGKADRHRDALLLEHGSPGPALRRDAVSAAVWQELKDRPSHHLCPDIYRGQTRAIRDERWKFCQTEGDVEELYDLHTDPDELENLAADARYDATRDACRERLSRMLNPTEPS